MKFEIAYFSKFGNSAVLAKAIANMLPAEDTKLVNLAHNEMAGGADVNFIGFDVIDGPVPLRIIDALDLAERKAIILFTTCCMEPSENVKSSIERKVQPFIPDDCDYRGLFLCAGQPSENILENIDTQLKRQPDNLGLRAALENCQKAIGHPNKNDIAMLMKFVQSALA